LAQVLRVRERQFLMGGLQRRRIVVFQIQGGGVEREFRREIPLRKIEAGGEPDIPAEPERRVAVQIEAALPPRARNDQGLDEIALNSVEIGRLMMFVQETERHEEQAGA
jgi:hypothetical protein